MRLPVVAVALTLITSPALAFDGGGFGSGVTQGYQQGEAQRLEIERLRMCNQNPMLCAPPAAPIVAPLYPDPPRRERVICQNLGNGFTHCRTY